MPPLPLAPPTLSPPNGLCLHQKLPLLLASCLPLHPRAVTPTSIPHDLDHSSGSREPLASPSSPPLSAFQKCKPGENPRRSSRGQQRPGQRSPTGSCANSQRAPHYFLPLPGAPAAWQFCWNTRAFSGHGPHVTTPHPHHHPQRLPSGSPTPALHISPGASRPASAQSCGASWFPSSTWSLRVKDLVLLCPQQPAPSLITTHRAHHPQHGLDGGSRQLRLPRCPHQLAVLSTSSGLYYCHFCGCWQEGSRPKARLWLSHPRPAEGRAATGSPGWFNSHWKSSRGFVGGAKSPVPESSRVIRYSMGKPPWQTEHL